MIREQCEHCKRHAYSNGRCYADRKMKGRPISEYLYCGWATPCKALPYSIIKRPKRKKPHPSAD